MFDLANLQSSTTMHRTGTGQWFSETLATFGLLFVIFGGLRARPEAVPALVGLCITGAYWFTSSTSLANPAVTSARGFSNTFAGIYPGHIPVFFAMQLIAVGIGHMVPSKLFAAPSLPAESRQARQTGYRGSGLALHTGRKNATMGGQDPKKTVCQGVPPNACTSSSCQLD